MITCYNKCMNNNSLDLGKLVLDIGGLNEMPTDRGITVRKKGEETVLCIANNDMLASIRLTKEEAAKLKETL